MLYLQFLRNTWSPLVLVHIYKIKQSDTCAVPVCQIICLSLAFYIYKREVDDIVKKEEFLVWFLKVYLLDKGLSLAVSLPDKNIIHTEIFLRHLYFSRNLSNHS